GARQPVHRVTALNLGVMRVAPRLVSLLVQRCPGAAPDRGRPVMSRSVDDDRPRGLWTRMAASLDAGPVGRWSWLPPVRWLGSYRVAWLPADIVAGVTLAAYAIPVSLAYAALADLPPEVGIYGYLLGGLGYALLGSSRQLAIGPTSAISLMIAASVSAMAEGDAQRYAQIASLAAFTVA